MAEHGNNEQEGQSDEPVEHMQLHKRGNRLHEHRFATMSSELLDRADTVIYAVVGTCFLLGAVLALGYSFWDFGVAMAQIPANSAREQPVVVVSAIIKLISDLLLVLIIMEVLGTVTHYLKAHATSLRPFLFIGIVSATRSILSIGARLSVGQVQGQEFTNAMIELGVSGAVILALGVTLKLLGKLVEID